MPRRYAILDVFADRPLAGNPLAVVLDSNGLDAARMQAVAAEFNLSETVFVCPPENSRHRAAIRIFTPKRELPFAGHPTVGTAVLLALESANGSAGAHEAMMVIEETVGPVRCGAFVKGEGAGRAIFDLPQEAVEIGTHFEPEAVAAALGLLPAEIGFENHEVTAYSAGVPYAFVPVRDLKVIARAAPNIALWGAAFGSGAAAAFVYCRETEKPDRHFHGRMFAPGLGIGEDPATGSAAAAFTGVIRRFDQPPSGTHRMTIEQGFEMGRPSLIGLEIDIAGGRIEGARIGGDAVVVARGMLSFD